MSLRLASLFDNPPTFQTPRLTLRPIAEGDLGDLFEVNRSVEVTRYLPYPAWQSSADAAAWYERAKTRWADRTAAQFAIRLQSRDSHALRTIGNALLLNFNDAHEIAEIGYVLGQAHWGQGFATEAMRPLVEYAFDTLGVHRLEARLDPRNSGSANVLRKLGFQQEALLRENWHDRVGRADTAVFGLLRREFMR